MEDVKILFLELSESDPVSLMPKSYGGAGVTIRKLADFTNSLLAAHHSCFDENDKNERYIKLDSNQIGQIKGRLSPPNDLLNNKPAIPNYDLIVHPHSTLCVNGKQLQLVWCVGQAEDVDPEIKHILLHNKRTQCPKIANPETQVHEFTLGIDIPVFERIEKRDFIFQCTNHYPQINSVLLANWARKNKITVIFAGPISNGYEGEFLKEIDYKSTFYLGQIREEEKIKLLKEARFFSSLFSHPINECTLAIKQAMSYGCGIITTNAGVMPEVIKNEVNGFIINNEQDFLNAWNYRDNIAQKACWETANRWGLDKMVESFKRVINEVTGKEVK